MCNIQDYTVKTNFTRESFENFEGFLQQVRKNLVLPADSLTSSEDIIDRKLDRKNYFSPNVDP